jgi:hypothetical protein
MHLRTTLFVGLLAGFAAAQQLTAHPQQTLQNGNGNIVPFGVISGGTFAEGRTHILVPANELPSIPALLDGIEIHGQATDVVDYASLTINIMPTTATSLSTTFANNLTGPVTTVLQATNLQVAYNSAWTRIPFTVQYVHDGSSAMLIEVLKVVQPGTAGYPFMTMSTSSSPPRTDRPAMAYALGGPGSGASQATNANVLANAIVHRLVWQGTPTVRHESGTGAASGNQYGLGGQVDAFVNGPAGHFWIMAAATTYLPAGVQVPGLQGEFRLNGPVTFASGLLDANGDGGFVVPLPNNPSLAGFFLCYQGAVVDPATVAITFTNAMDHFVNL